MGDFKQASLTEKMRRQLIPVMFFLLLSSCFTNDFLEEIPNVDLEDKFTIRRFEFTDLELGTVFMDSLQTSGTPILSLGKHTDPYRGMIKISPYFEFTPGTAISRFDDEQILDSMVLVLKISSTHFDTIPEFTLNIWEITEEFVPANEGKDFYDFHSLRTGRNPIHSTKIQVFPSRDSLRISLPRKFAEVLFEKCKGPTSILSSAEAFKEAFTGLKLEAVTEGPILSFTKDSYLTIYHQDRGELNRESESYQIPIGTLAKSFLQVERDRSMTPFANSALNRIIPSSDTDQITLSDQLGLAYTAITFGDLTSFGLIPSGFHLAEANLILPVKRETYSRVFNPFSEKLDIYSRGSLSQIPKFISQASISFTDHIFQETTFFKIPITDFVLNKIRGKDYGSFIWIEVADAEKLDLSFTAFGRNSNNYRPKLELILLPLN